MGVRGLSSYIAKNHSKYLKNHKLHDCYVIIDGNSLTYHIYSNFNSRAHCAFGGDYDKFAQSIKDFFVLLSKCDIKPIVLIDGGYERRKVYTVIKRMREKVYAVKRVQPCSQHCTPVYPMFMKTIMKEVLKEMNIPFVQCDFEADQEISALARKYDCPVLSNDSDFYIYNVSYIPIPTLDFYESPLYFQLGQTCDKFCINCKIYNVDFYLRSFGGLDRSMLPLLASLLGNDYINTKVFKKFYLQFSFTRKKGIQSQLRASRLIEWLKHETFESAVKKVLGKIKRAQHRAVMSSIMKTVKVYTGVDSTVEPYLPPEFTSRSVQQNLYKAPDVDACMPDADDNDNTEGMDVDDNEKDGNDDNPQVSDDSSDSEDEDSEEDDKSSKPDEMVVEVTEQINKLKETAHENPVKIPDWLKDSFRRGNIDPCVYDILTLKTYFVYPQMEDMSLTSSHVTSLPLIKLICKLLIGNSSEKVRLLMKIKGNAIRKFLLNLNNTLDVANIESIPSMSINDRKSLVLRCLNVPNEFCLDSFPDEWKLYICTIVFWIKQNVEPQVTESHVFALLMCIVSLSIINVKVGVFKKRVGFLKKYGKMQKKIIRNVEFDSDLDSQSDNKADVVSSLLDTDETMEKPESNAIKEIVSSLTTEDCIAAFDGFHSFHQIDEKLKANPRFFSTQTIHSFAQFKSCLYHAMILNSLLGYPLDRVFVSHLYSGTFVYNICVALSNAKDVTEHIQSLLKHSPNIFKLVKSMFLALKSVLNIAVGQPSPRKNRRKRKKRKISETVTEDASNDDEVNESDDVNEDDGYQDENNMFSVLSVG